MDINKINSWLQDSNRDYSTGLSIYDSYKLNKKFDDFFAKEKNPSPDSTQFKMLVQRVGEIARKLKQNPALTKKVPISVKPITIDDSKKKGVQQSGTGTNQNTAGNTGNPNRPRIVENPLVDVKELPEALQQLYFENKKLTKEIGDMHSQLKAVPKGEKHNKKRKELANLICNKDDNRASNWLAIDTWWKENKELTDEQKAQFDARKVDLKASLKEAKIILQRIDTLKINISREKKRIEKDPKLAEKLNPKIADWEKELGELEEKMK